MEFRKSDIYDNLVSGASFSEYEADKIYQTLSTFISDLSLVRDSEKSTERILSILEKLPDREMRIVQHWLIKSIQEDNTFVYAYNDLAQTINHQIKISVAPYLLNTTSRDQLCKLLKEEKLEAKFDFENVKNHLHTLLDTNSRIKYLIEIKTEYTQSDFESKTSTQFDRQCELEIIKLKELADIDAKQIQTNEKPQLSNYSNGQLVLIFYYFFKHNGLELRVDINISPIAKFIHLITGKELSVIQNSDFYKKLQKAPNIKVDKELINDLEVVKALFMRVQLDEIVKMIDNEIDVSRQERKTRKK